MSSRIFSVKAAFVFSSLLAASLVVPTSAQAADAVPVADIDLFLEATSTGLPSEAALSSPDASADDDANSVEQVAVSLELTEGIETFDRAQIDADQISVANSEAALLELAETLDAGNEIAHSNSGPRRTAQDALNLVRSEHRPATVLGIIARESRRVLIPPTIRAITRFWR